MLSRASKSPAWRKQESPTPVSSRKCAQKRRNLIQLSLFIVGLVGASRIIETSCEAREIDWSELGVSLGSKSNIGANGSNLRILVSPQRRMTKSYDLDYTNGTQANSGESAHVIASSGGSYQPSGQISPSIAGPSHSSAYSALSASIASLRSRLNARGVNLAPISDNYTQSNYYPSAPSSYSSYPDSSSQAQAIQIPSSPTGYVSVTSHHESNSNQPSYVSGSGQTNDNKTIVLAIPAKINFLSDNRSPSVMKQQTSQPQPQQVTIIQPTDSISSGEYSGLINGQEAVADQPTLVGRENSGSEHEHQQYVIVNSPSASSEPQQIVQTGTPLYTTSGQIYSQIGSSQQLKYLPTFSTTSSGQQPMVQKVPAVGEQGGYYDQGDLSVSRSCPDTCNIGDPKWRRYSFAKYRYCCSRTTQYETQYEQPSLEKANEKTVDDGYYSYLYRRSRSRRSRKNRKPSRYQASGSDDLLSNVDTPKVPRAYQTDSPYMRYYKNRQQSTADGSEASTEDLGSRSTKYQARERSYRKSRSRELDPSTGSAQADANEEEQSEPFTRPASQSSYGGGEYSVEAGRYPQESSRAQSEEEEPRVGGEDSYEVDGKSDEYSSSEITDGQGEDGSEVEPMGNKYTSSGRNRRKSSKSRSKKGANRDKLNKKSRKAKAYKQDSTSQTNGTDYEATAPGDSYHPEPNIPSEDDQSQTHQKEATPEASYNTELDTKSKLNLTDSTAINLSKTTMHLKEILSILEKKAQLRANETNAERQAPTFAPITTTPSSLYSMNLFGSQYSSMLPSDLLPSDLALKSPYRLDPTSLSSSLSSSPSFSSISSALTSLANSETFNPLSSYSSGHYSLPPSKPYGVQPMAQRKRRPTKAVRYNNYNSMQKSHGLGIPPSILNSPQAKNYLLSSGYYPSLGYPYWHPRLHPSVTNSYPYRNIHKNPYSSMVGSPPKMPSSGVYGEERGQGMSNYDPIVSVASSLRPSTTMRLRSKPFMLPPHVLPMYARHSLLSSALDVKK